MVIIDFHNDLGNGLVGVMKNISRRKEILKRTLPLVYKYGPTA